MFRLALLLVLSELELVAALLELAVRSIERQSGVKRVDVSSESVTLLFLDMLVLHLVLDFD